MMHVPDDTPLPPSPDATPWPRCRLARHPGSPTKADTMRLQAQLLARAAWSGFHSSATTLQQPVANAPPPDLAGEIEHATGLER